MGDIKINVSELNSELSKFNDAIKEFEPYSKNFIKKTTKKFTKTNGCNAENF